MLIYHLILKIRDLHYRYNRKAVKKAEVPAICVGNITVGGTGKTPHSELVVRTLQESEKWKGRHLAVLSRGYKRKSRGFQQVKTDSSASFAGDEPLQIKKKFPDVTVAVDKNRLEGCDFLVHPEKIASARRGRKTEDPDFPSSELIVLDDAFQYRRLRADLNILLVDYGRPVFKDSLLPFGRLRDLPSRVADADLIVVTKCPSILEDDERIAFANGLKVMDYDVKDCSGFLKGGKRVKVLFSTIAYSVSVPLFPEANPRYIYSKKVVLFSGIANDVPFRNYLCDSYRIVSRLVFPDHHRYTRSDFSKILSAVKKNPTAGIATTEKDAQRIVSCRKIPAEIVERLFYVPIIARFLTDEEEEMFREIICSI